MSERLDIGAVKSVKIDVLTETGWFDDARLKQDMAAYGGSEQTQYRIAWDAENAGGYAALLTLTLLDGDQRKILLDTGWNTEWMDYVFARHGVDRMLERGEIDFMVLSHWHLDHFWGIESTLKHNPRLKIYAPATWRALRESGVEIEIRVGDPDDPLAGMVRISSGSEPPVDLVVGDRGWQRRAIERAEPRVLAGARLPVVRVVDLILLKLYAAGQQDIEAREHPRAELVLVDGRRVTQLVIERIRAAAAFGVEEQLADDLGGGAHRHGSSKGATPGRRVSPGGCAPGCGPAHTPGAAAPRWAEATNAGSAASCWTRAS